MKTDNWNKFSKKYSHVGYSYLGVPKPWMPIVAKAVIAIEKDMWPQWWLPMFVKRWIHWLATGNSVVRVKYWWARNLRNKLAHGQIHDIKDKYASLRIYGSFSKNADYIIRDAEFECLETCEWCGSKIDVEVVNYGWWYNLCAECRTKEENRILLNWYKYGFDDELNGTSSTLPNSELVIFNLIEKAYNLGAAHAVIGDDVKSIDNLSDNEILERIKKE